MNVYWFCSVWINMCYMIEQKEEAEIDFSVFVSLIYLGINSYQMGKLTLTAFKNTFYFHSTVIHDDGSAK